MKLITLYFLTAIVYSSAINGHRYRAYYDQGLNKAVERQLRGSDDNGGKKGGKKAGGKGGKKDSGKGGKKEGGENDSDDNGKGGKMGSGKGGKKEGGENDREE